MLSQNYSNHSSHDGCLPTLLKLLQTLKGDLELIVVGKLGGVIEDINPQK